MGAATGLGQTPPDRDLQASAAPGTGYAAAVPPSGAIISLDLSAWRLYPTQLGGYLERVGLDSVPSPDPTGLAAVHRAHLYSIPFENLDIHLGTPIRLDRDGLFDKLVGRRRGGFCYENNLVFAGALLALGFRLDLLSARVWGEAAFGPPFDHMTLRVWFGDIAVLADVGFGDSFELPLPLDDLWHQRAEGERFRLRSEGDEWTLEILPEDGRDPVPLYCFDLTPRPPEDYRPMCHFQQTSPDVWFTQRWVVTLPTERGRLTASPSGLHERAEGWNADVPIDSVAKLEHVLRYRFGMTGIELPADFPI